MQQPVFIMSAVAGESALLGDEMTDVEVVEIGGHEFRRGVVAGRSVVAADSGIGKINATVVAVLGIDHFDPAALVFTGVAGSLDESVRIGDVIVAERVVHHDTGMLEPDGFHVYQAGHVPFFNPTDELGYRPSPRLLDAVRDVVDGVRLRPVLGRPPDIVFGTVGTCDQFVHSAADRARLHAIVGARAIEMEGAAVAQVAEHFGVDHLVIRAVSDLAGEESVVDFTRFFKETAANSVRLVIALLSQL